jgi:cell division protease FtsH
VSTKKTPPPRRAPAGGPQFQILFLLLAVLGVLWAQRLFHTATNVAEIPYSRFLELVDEKAVDSISVTGDYVSGKFRQPVGGKREFVTTRVDDDLANRLRERGIGFDRKIESTFLRDLLSWIVPVLFFAIIWIFLMRRMGGGVGGGGNFLSVGKSKARIYAETEISVRFKDVAGVDEAKAELQEVVDFLKNPASYGRLGGRMPKGVLLVGPPGTGKTLLAKAVAGEAKVPFFSISGSEFVEMFVGVGAARVRDLFEQARKKAPAIIFIDELDALGRARSAGGFGGGGHDEKEQTLNQLLVEMDGFDSTQGLMLLAATNRPEILDPALLRAGRFDRQVLVDRPDKEGRKAILQVHMKKIQVTPDLDLDTVASITSGFTGADLANLVNEAALIATRAGAKLVSQEHFTEGMERIVAGLEKKSRILSQKEKEIVAHHEMGHALVGAAVPGSSAVHKVSIIPRGVGALGYTIQRPTEDRFLMTREELEQKLCVLLGGRAAEKVIFGHLSTGASDDLSRATDTARGMAMRYGMVESLGQATYEREPQGFLNPGANSRDYSEKTAAAIDAAVQEILDKAFARTTRFLQDNLDLLKESARDLLAKETLTEEALKPYFAKINPSALQA